MSEPLVEPYGSRITITGAGRRATITGAQLADAARQIQQKSGPVYDALQGEMPAAEQLDLPFPLDQAKLGEFLTRWLAIEDEEDRLREDKRQLKEDYADDFPMRGVLTAVKRVRALQKLEAHPKEGMKREHLTVIENLVERHLLDMRKALDDLEQAIDEKLQKGEHGAVNRATGEVAK